jgi:GntR family transcriptional regulator
VTSPDHRWDPRLYRYEQIALIVEQRIDDGTYPVLSVISEVQLMNEFGVGRGTIRRAFQLLRDRGRIMTKPGRGSVVLGNDSATPLP